MSAELEPRLTGAVIVLDEEQMLPGCLESLSFCDEVLVVDGGSRDRSLELARSAGARVLSRPFDDFPRQRNHALEQARGEWVLFVDADERVPSALAREIRSLVATDPDSEAFTVPRRAWALGRDMPSLYRFPDLQTRLLRRKRARYDESEPVHEVVRHQGLPGRLQNPLWHFTHRGISHVLGKLDQYSAVEAGQLAGRGWRGLSGPRLLGSFLRDLFGLLVLRGGLAHGPEGVAESLLLAHYRFLVRARLWELTRTPSLDQTYQELEREWKR